MTALSRSLNVAIKRVRRSSDANLLGITGGPSRAATCQQGRRTDEHLPRTWTTISQDRPIAWGRRRPLRFTASPLPVFGRMSGCRPAAGIALAFAADDAEICGEDRFEPAPRRCRGRRVARLGPFCEDEVVAVWRDIAARAGLPRMIVREDGVLAVVSAADRPAGPRARPASAAVTARSAVAARASSSAARPAACRSARRSTAARTRSSPAHAAEPGRRSQAPTGCRTHRVRGARPTNRIRPASRFERNRASAPRPSRVSRRRTCRPRWPRRPRRRDSPRGPRPPAPVAASAISSAASAVAEADRPPHAARRRSGPRSGCRRSRRPRCPAPRRSCRSRPPRRCVPA